MGETLTSPSFQFNGSVRMETREERLTCEPGALVHREVLERLGITSWLAERIEDPRNQRLITHPVSELLQTLLLLLCQGWRDQDDADYLRDDPALRLSVSNRRGLSPLETRDEEERERDHNPPVPDGLPSQPTLSRLLGVLGSQENRTVLRQALLECASRRLKSMRGGRRQRYLTVDIDSLPITVHGRQPGSTYNGYYHRTVYHPLVATVAETGDLLDAQLREGNAHTADGAADFIIELLDDVESSMCQVAAVRMDAGFPSGETLTLLEARQVPYVARIKNNATLDRLAEPHLRRPPGRPPQAPRTWFHEMTYRAESWTHERRAVLVVQEVPGELFLNHFWLLTSWTKEQASAESLLEHYRERGQAESHFGELMSVLEPALSSSPRPKKHYRGNPITDPRSSCDSFARNEVTLLLNMLAYNITHVSRTLLERASRTPWSLRKIRERMFRAAARVILHARRATLIVGKECAALWSLLWTQLAKLQT